MGSEYVSSFEYLKVLNIPGLSICQGSGFLGFHRVWLFSQIWQGFEYVLGYNYWKVLNIPGFRICQVSAHARVTEGSEYAWIRLNNTLINYSGSFTGLNNAECAWIYLNKQSCEYARILNVSDVVCIIRSLYKLLSGYRDRGIFRTTWNI